QRRRTIGSWPLCVKKGSACNGRMSQWRRSFLAQRRSAWPILVRTPCPCTAAQILAHGVACQPPLFGAGANGLALNDQLPYGLHHPTPQHGFYDPALYNDRLLLGLKGTMSEVELHLLKQRLYQGCLRKARRGALTFALPIGYIWDADGAIQFDPDEQVQAVGRLILTQFPRPGPLCGL